MNCRAMILAAALCALAACGGGSGGGAVRESPEAPVTLPESPPVTPPVTLPESPPESPPVTPPVILPPPPEVGAPLGKRLADGTDMYNRRHPLEGYIISGGEVRDPTPGIDSDNPVDTPDPIINVPDWSGSKWVRMLGEDGVDSVTGGLRDEFVLFTDKDDDSTPYMDMGYWIRYIPLDGKDKRISSEDIHTITTFSLGSEDLAKRLHEVAYGDAMYSGPAVGLYAKRVGGEQGEFRARAALTVDFDATPPPGVVNWKPPISVSGTIFNFRDAQGNVIDSSWNVTLKERLYDGSRRPSHGGYQTGATDNGQYVFDFFGPATADANGDINPEYIGGSFWRSFGNGAVSGAFAASRD